MSSYEFPFYMADTESEFRARVISYIKENYKDTLGQDLQLLDQPDGLDQICRRIQELIDQTEIPEIS